MIMIDDNTIIFHKYDDINMNVIYHNYENI